MIIIGLTGGTGSGKTTVASMCIELGAYVIDADLVARKIVQKGTPALKEIVSYFGCDILLLSGELDRKKLGRIVFSDKGKLRMLNDITYKYITKEIEKEIDIVK